MADKYRSNKSDVLDVQSKGGLALRMALGETQVVAETKEFLLNHGVKLDAFGQVSYYDSYPECQPTVLGNSVLNGSVFFPSRMQSVARQ
jgi:hypothetical protein